MILDTILDHKRAEIARLDLSALRRRAADAPAPRDFVAGLRQSPSRPALIAEVKFASPSRGVLLPNGDAVQLAETYASAGAAALSILTDEKFFRGSLASLQEVRATCSPPLLRKDFIIDPAQAYETRAAGADAILLIVAAFDDDSELASLHALAIELGLTPLVEVHTRAELERALRLDAKLIGVNNRDLHTFEVSLETTASLRPLIPVNIAVVSESGVSTPADMVRLAAMEVDAALVGEALVTAPDIAAKVRDLVTRSHIGVGIR